jgi:radical SAM superfamily enzyme YgiQ (UPF0313 family)
MSDITVVNLYFADPDEEGKAGFVPLGPLYLTAALEEAGFSVDFRDYLVEGQQYRDPVDVESVLSFLKDSAAILAVGCSSCTLPVAIHALERLKGERPGMTVILGGIGATGVSRLILQYFPFIDMVIRGEGEVTIVHLLRALESGDDLEGVKGIDFRRDGSIFSNPPQSRIRDLDRLPFPAYHKIDLNRYSRTGLITARGCPFQCTFCDVAPFWGRGLYFKRSIGNVMEEVRLLKEEYKQETITLFDETFPISRQRVSAFCRAMKQEMPAMRWTCSARISPMEVDLLKEMRDAGCFMVFYGVESGSDVVLRKTKKGYTREQAERVIESSLRYMFVNAFFMWGFPFESLEDFYLTMDFVERAARKGVIPVVHIVNSLPMSELYIQNRDKLAFSRQLYEGSLLLRHPEIVELIETFPSVFPGFYHCDSLIERKYEIARDKGLANNLITLDALGQEYASYYGGEDKESG